MKYLIAADIHANLEAFQAVLNSVAFDQLIIPGDLLGYGPFPNECVQLAVQYGAIAVLGNHEAALIDPLRADNFNPLARRALDFTGIILRTENLEYIKSLKYETIHDGFYVTHGSPYQPERFDYLHGAQFRSAETHLAFKRLERLGITIAFAAHTHVPGIFTYRSHSVRYQSLQPDLPVELTGPGIYLINPGSVGQPRNLIPEAQCVIYDDAAGTVLLKACSYSREAYQAKIQEYGLPDALWQRLEKGI